MFVHIELDAIENYEFMDHLLVGHHVSHFL